MIYGQFDDLFSFLQTNIEIVWVNGVFDLLHDGHIKLLKEAYALTVTTTNAALFVGVNTDSSVRRLKGPTRPIQSYETRAQAISSLGYVNHIIPLTTDSPKDILYHLRPKYVVKGSDYRDKIESAEEYATVRSFGEFRFVDLLPGVSTTQIIRDS